MSITITPTKLKGRVTVPPSKSASHRMLICAGLADGESTVQNIALSEDIAATIGALKALGRSVAVADGKATVGGRLSGCVNGTIDCNESGSTLRFFIPIVSALGGGLMTGKPLLLARPLDVYEKAFARMGKRFSVQNPLAVPKGLHDGLFLAQGDVSSQFISGVLLAAPLLGFDTEIRLTSPLESRAYAAMTVQAMQGFGVSAEQTETGFWVKAGQAYRAADVCVEGDWSQAAFWALAGLASENGISIEGLSHDTRQGDRALIEILKAMGVSAETETGISVKKSDLSGAEIDISETPDLAPAVAGLLAVSGKPGRLTGGKRLRIKESDRLLTIAKTLNALGSTAEVAGDAIEIFGKPTGGSVQTFRDHRIAMMAAALSPFCEKAVVIEDETVVNKSYPNFWQDFANLGGKYV